MNRNNKLKILKERTIESTSVKSVVNDAAIIPEPAMMVNPETDNLENGSWAKRNADMRR
jgi:hypothetical protein